MTEKAWFTLGEVAAALHVARLTAWRQLRPFRARCHLARQGSHPRLCLWVPAEVVRELEGGRIPRIARERRGTETPVKPLSP
jgi:hypothetical protein